MFALLSTLLLAFTALAAPSSNYPTTTAPLLGFSYPKPFLGLDDGFSNPAIGYVSFIPGFHACGTLSIFSIEPGVEEGDWGLLPRNSSSDGGNATVEAGGDGSAATEEGGEMGLWERYDEAPTQLIDTAAVEGHILAWARGWRKSCGKGEENKEVRVTKVLVDGADARADRAGWVVSLDEHLKPLLAALPPPPHNNVVLITSLTPSTLMTLFDLASPPPSSPSKPSNPTDPFPDRSTRRRTAHGLVYRLLALIFHTLFYSLLMIGAFVVAKQYNLIERAQTWWEERRAAGGIRLPTSGLGERELEFELGDEEDAEGAEELPAGALGRALEANGRK